MARHTDARRAGQKNCAPVHLLLNGTEVRSGRRIITSTLDLHDHAGAPLMPSAISFFEDSGKDVAPATAVMNSARFPYISPAGRYRSRHRTRNTEPIWRQVVDGGYFENYGVETALELIEAIEAIDTSLIGFTPVPYLVVISNSSAEQQHNATASAHPELAQFDLMKRTILTCSADALLRWQKLEYDANASRLFAESSAPLQSLISTRPSHAFEALQDARTKLCPRGGSQVAGHNASLRTLDRMFHFALPAPHESGGVAAPFNWVLTDESADYMTGEALKHPWTAKQLDFLYAALQQ